MRVFEFFNTGQATDDPANRQHFHLTGGFTQQHAPGSHPEWDVGLAVGERRERRFGGKWLTLPDGRILFIKGRRKVAGRYVAKAVEVFERVGDELRAVGELGISGEADRDTYRTLGGGTGHIWVSGNSRSFSDSFTERMHRGGQVHEVRVTTHTELRTYNVTRMPLPEWLSPNWPEITAGLRGLPGQFGTPKRHVFALVRSGYWGEFPWVYPVLRSDRPNCERYIYGCVGANRHGGNQGVGAVGWQKLFRTAPLGPLILERESWSWTVEWEEDRLLPMAHPLLEMVP